MIFVTVGTEQFPFNRLLDWVARAVKRDQILETIIVQSGACTNTIPGATHYKTLPQAEFKTISQEARLIISHCGEGSFFNLRHLGQPYVLVPRRHGLGEHVDDHQWEMAKALTEVGVAIGWIPHDVQRFIQHPPVIAAIELNAPSLLDHLAQRYLTKPLGGQ